MHYTAFCVHMDEVVMAIVASSVMCDAVHSKTDLGCVGQCLDRAGGVDFLVDQLLNRSLHEGHEAGSNRGCLARPDSSSEPATASRWDAAEPDVDEWQATTTVAHVLPHRRTLRLPSFPQAWHLASPARPYVPWRHQPWALPSHSLQR